MHIILALFGEQTYVIHYLVTDMLHALIIGITHLSLCHLFKRLHKIIAKSETILKASLNIISRDENA